MALSPWYLSRTFEDHEAAALLAGYEDINPESDSWLDVDTALLGQWVERMIDAAHRRELELLEIRATTIDARSIDYSKMQGVPFEMQGAPFDRSLSMEEMAHEKLRNVIFKIERSELYNWLRASGIEDDAIPEALRVMPKPQTPAEQSPTQPTAGEELRALEALGLLAVTFAKQAPKYQRNGKPNCAQIAKAMDQQAGKVSGMGDSKLARLLSDALAAWEEKRG